MNNLLASVRLPRGVGSLFLAAYALASIPSCSGPSVQRTEGKTIVKTPPASRVVVIVRDGETSVESTPIPIWESVISGVIGGAFKGLTSANMQRNDNL